jgi:hypothetical protein
MTTYVLITWNMGNFLTSWGIISVQSTPSHAIRYFVFSLVVIGYKAEVLNNSESERMSKLPVVWFEILILEFSGRTAENHEDTLVNQSVRAMAADVRNKDFPNTRQKLPCLDQMVQCYRWKGREDNINTVLFAVRMFTLLRQNNKYTHCLQLHICISITPTCLGGPAAFIRGAPNVRLRSAPEVLYVCSADAERGPRRSVYFLRLAAGFWPRIHLLQSNADIVRNLWLALRDWIVFFPIHQLSRGAFPTR